MKRSADELDARNTSLSRADTKRVRLSPTADARSDSSVPSSCSVSETSALHSSPEAMDGTTQDSSISSMQSSGYEDTESSLSSSSEESSDYESDDEIVTIGGPKKPQIGSNFDLSGAQSLQERIASLLPQLQAANRELEDGAPGRSMEVVEDGEQHIEMNLGLGVLEEKHGDETTSSDESSDESSDSDDENRPSEGEEMPISSGAMVQERGERDTDVMRKLLGQRKDRRKPAIEDLG